MSDLHRFTRQLVESLSAHDPTALGAPLPLDAITTRVLPYRACRRLFGILNVEDYELLLLRLVAGEGGLAAGSPLDAVERCRAELDTGHPDPGVLNELEGVTLRLHLGAIALGDVAPVDAGSSIVRSYALYEPEAEPEPERESGAEPGSDAVREPVEPVEVETELALEESEAIASPEPVEMLAGSETDEAVAFDSMDTPAAAIDDLPPTPELPPDNREPEPEADPFQELFEAPDDGVELEPEPDGPEPPARAAEATSTPPEPVAPPPPATHGEPPPRCPHCASRLPSGRPVRFCPHCGSNVVPLQCISCGADLEPAWRHCVLCGAPAVHDSRFA